MEDRTTMTILDTTHAKIKALATTEGKPLVWFMEYAAEVLIELARSEGKPIDYNLRLMGVIETEKSRGGKGGHDS